MVKTYEVYQMQGGRWGWVLYEDGKPVITGGNYAHRSSAVRGAIKAQA